MKEIKINTEYITLGQLLKILSLVPSGAQSKIYLIEYDVKVNGEIEKRRGRKLYPDYLINIPKTGLIIIK